MKPYSQVSDESRGQWGKGKTFLVAFGTVFVFVAFEVIGGDVATGEHLEGLRTHADFFEHSLVIGPSKEWDANVQV